MNESTTDLRSVIATATSEALSILLRNLPVVYQIVEVSLYVSRRALIKSPASNTVEAWVLIETDNRALLLGQFLKLATEEDDGYFIPFLRGYVLGRVWSDDDNRHRLVDVSFDCTEKRVYAGDKIHLYRMISVHDAEKIGLFESGSEYALALGRYNVSKILTAGRVISGPSLLLMKTVEQISERLRGPARMLDVFAGTLGSSAVALQRAETTVTAFDLSFSREAKENIECGIARCTFIEGDYSTWQFGEEFDFAVLDPFYEHAYSPTESWYRNYYHFAASSC